MSFKILNKDGEALTIKQLDAEAAEFWNKTVDPKWYANPSPEGTSVFKQRGNWFDTIGYQIHSPGDYTSGWDNVKCSLWTIQVQGLYDKPVDELPEQIAFIKEYLKPYYDLINHWESKGYQPKQIKE